MMDDDRPTLITIPTELDRSDAFVVLATGAGFLLAGWWLLQQGVPPPLVMLPAIVIGTWMLTSRSACEVRVIGSIAVWARTRLGERDVHEWVVALVHFIGLVYVPKGRAQCARLWRSAQRRASRLPHRSSA